MQYKAALVIPGVIQGNSRGKKYQELVSGSLKSRRWYKRLSLIIQIIKEQGPNYLINLIPKYKQIIRAKNNCKPFYCCRAESFKHSFSPTT